MSDGPIHGEVAPGYEPVKAAFAAHASEMGAGGAAFAAVVDGRLVVDLWAGRAGDDDWQRDTRCVLMSSTKGVVAAAVARLVDRGELDVDAPVARYWPEFAAGGKEAITVAQLLSHSAGLISVPGYETFMSADGEGWDQTEEIVRRLETAVPEWTPGTALGYHGLTIGWLAAELVRRIAGVSVGTVIREELAEPLGLELDLGTPVERQHLVAPLILPGGRSLVDEDELSDPAMAARMLLTVDGRSVLDTAPAFFGDSACLELELSGSNATGTARSLATLYGALANGGSYGDVQLLSPETIETCTVERGRGPDRMMGVEARWGLGFARPTAEAMTGELFPWGPHEEAFGAHGYGGQVGFGDPVARTGIGFVRSELSEASPLSSNLLRALYACLEEDGAMVARQPGAIEPAG